MLKLVDEDDPILRQMAQPVTLYDQQTRKFIIELAQIMQKHNGIGIAAPQVGVSKRIVLVEGIGILINPQIVATSNERICFQEGCLSLPGQFKPVTRSNKVTVKFYTAWGTEQQISVDKLTAVIVQHEIDHLNGILFTDY